MSAVVGLSDELEPFEAAKIWPRNVARLRNRECALARVRRREHLLKGFPRLLLFREGFLPSTLWPSPFSGSAAASTAVRLDGIGPA